MKPLSDFFFETDVKDMGPDMVSYVVLIDAEFNTATILSHEVTIFPILLATGSFLFCLLVTGVRHFWFVILPVVGVKLILYENLNF